MALVYLASRTVPDLSAFFNTQMTAVPVISPGSSINCCISHLHILSSPRKGTVFADYLTIFPRQPPLLLEAGLELGGRPDL